MRSLRRIIIFAIPLLIAGFVISTLYKWNYITHQERLPGEFGIPELGASIDINGNHVNDAKDVFLGAMNYVSADPVYEPLKEYTGGWPTGKNGSNGDVVAYALKNAGLDLQTLINQDIAKNPDAYSDKVPQGKDISFRVVENQRVYFSRYAEAHDTDYYNIKDWQMGDIVFFEKNHAAVVADKVNNNGVRFIVHLFWEHQAGYYQDVLETNAWGKVTGHYRITQEMGNPKTDYKNKKTK